MDAQDRRVDGERFRDGGEDRPVAGGLGNPEVERPKSERRPESEYGHRVLGEGEFGYYPALQQVFLDDSLQDLRSAGVVPDTFGIDDRDGALCADAQAVGFCAIDQRGWSDEV